MAIFSLNEIRTEQIKNIANDNFESWPESATYGYFAGGLDPAGSPIYVDTVDRIDFSSETTSLPGNDLPSGRWHFATVSSSSYGYFGGGYDGSNHIDTINRLDFSNETFSAPGNNLSQVRQGLGGTQSSSYGYFAGGTDPAVSPSYVDTVDRIDFSSETMSTPGNDLPSGRYSFGEVSSSSYGYFGGGYDGSSHIDTINRLDFSSETFSAPGNNLSQVRQGLGGTQSSSYGYFGGGINPAVSPSIVDTVDRIDFLNETASLPGNNLPSGRRLPGTSQSSSYGYFGGGYDGSNHIDTINRLDFSNETFSAPGNNLSQVRQGLAGVSGGASYRISGSRTYGYFGGGQFTPLALSKLTIVDRIDFSSETMSTLGNNLSQGRQYLAATSSNSYGYFGGGRNPSVSPLYLSTVERLDFSNETISDVGDLSIGRFTLAACSSSSYGYFAGGRDPGSSPTYISTVDRLDFSNDTLSLPDQGRSILTQGSSVVSNSSYGYFGGGIPYIDTVERLDFSSETFSLPGDDLLENRGYAAGVSNSNFGYFGGGRSPSYQSTIDRLDFSNGTMTPGNNLSQARSNLAATQSSSDGYFAAGGEGATRPCTIDRLDFSSETTSTPFGAGNGLPAGNTGSAAVSN